jgi:hypothetical protein
LVITGRPTASRCADRGGTDRAILAGHMRSYSNGSTSNEMNHCIEVEIYGK